jgi:hypothetical protein
MIELTARVRELRQYITDEVIKIVGLPANAWTRAALGPVVYTPAQRFSQIAVNFDRRVMQEGLPQAARWALGQFRTRLEVAFQGTVPEAGSLLIASNHPGTVDALAIASSINRPDLKIVASGLPFLRGLPATAHHLLYLNKDTHDRMGVVRQMLRHLRGGGALLIFPSGNVDPDPAVLPGAEQALRSWSRSLGLILRSLPDTQVLVGIVSGVLSAVHLRNPIAWIRREARERQKLAEFLQVIQQMVFRGGEMLEARLTLSPVVPAGHLGPPGTDAQSLTRGLVQFAQGLLREHQANWTSLPKGPN